MVSMTKDDLIPGGKSLSGDGSHSPRLSFSVPADWKTELDQAAKDRGMGTAKLLRQIVGEWLTSRGK